MGWLILLIALIPLTASADDVVAARTLPAGTVITSADIRVAPGDPAIIADTDSVIGKSTRFAIYEGRPISPSALTAPMLVSRNQLVKLTYRSAALSITADGRALAAGQAGDVIAVMNIGSRATLQAQVQPDGSLSVLKN